MIAFIIGNGKSRSKFDLKQLSGAGVIYGCNAIYRTNPDEVDFVVAIDDGIIREIEQSDFPSKRVIIPPVDERWEPEECNFHCPRSNAGMNAILEAIKAGTKTIIGLGFDFLLLDSTDSVSNLYDGTKNYGMETRANALDNPNRVRYMNYVMSKNPDVEFFFAFPEIKPTLRTLKGKVITHDRLTEFLYANG